MLVFEITMQEVKETVAQCVKYERNHYGPLVKWLRHKTFNLGTGVRFPYGLPGTIVFPISDKEEYLCH